MTSASNKNEARVRRLVREWLRSCRGDLLPLDGLSVFFMDMGASHHITRQTQSLIALFCLCNRGCP